MNSLPAWTSQHVVASSSLRKVSFQRVGVRGRIPGAKPRGIVQTGPSRRRATQTNAARRSQIIVAAIGAGTVRIIIQGRKFELTDSIRDYTNQKISRAVEHFQQAVKEVDVNMSVRGGDTGTKGDRQHKVEVTIHTLRNGTIRAETVADSMYASIDLVCDKVQRQLRKVKEKAIGKGKWPGRAGERGGPKMGEVMDPLAEIEISEDQRLPEIARTKYHFVKALTEQEAIDELEKLDHDFYVYKDAEEKGIRVVYRRKERGYGVIIPIDQSEA